MLLLSMGYFSLPDKSELYKYGKNNYVYTEKDGSAKYSIRVRSSKGQIIETLLPAVLANRQHPSGKEFSYFLYIIVMP